MRNAYVGSEQNEFSPWCRNKKSLSFIPQEVLTKQHNNEESPEGTLRGLSTDAQVMFKQFHTSGGTGCVFVEES
jgi:hypothetical protein